MRERTALVNALRAHLAEFGVIAPLGLRNIARLIGIVRDESDARLPDLARQVPEVLATQVEQLEKAVAALEKQLMSGTRTTRSASVWRPSPGSDRSSPPHLPRRWWKQAGSAAVASLRRGWVWCRGNIRPVAKHALAAYRSAVTGLSGISCGGWA